MNAHAPSEVTISRRRRRSGHPARRNQPPNRTSNTSTSSTTASVDGPVESTPEDGSRYPQILRGPAYSARASVAGVVIGIVLFLLFTPVVTQLVTYISWLTTGNDIVYATYVSTARAFERPAGMLAANFGIAALIPISAALMMLVHHTHPRWLTSVEGRLRWRYLLASAVVALVILGGLLTFRLTSGPPLDLTPQNGFVGFLAVILITSPLQATAEEVFFRGYLTQALGSLVTNPWFGVVVSSVVFALFHGGQNLPLFIDRLAFGFLASVLVMKTGGLEASIAAHIINNVLAYTSAGLIGTISQTRAINAITWNDAIFDVGGFALFALVAWLISRQIFHLRQVVTTI